MGTHFHGESCRCASFAIGGRKHQRIISFPDAAAHIHIQEIIPGTEAMLTTPGLTRGIRCAECGEILSPQAEIPPFSKVACFVDRCYDKILDRQADEGGLNGWSEALAKKIDHSLIHFKYWLDEPGGGPGRKPVRRMPGLRILLFPGLLLFFLS